MLTSLNLFVHGTRHPFRPLCHLVLLASIMGHTRRLVIPGSAPLPTPSIYRLRQPITSLPNYLVEHRGSSGSECDLQATDRGFDPDWAELYSGIVLLGKALCPHVHFLDPGE